jgi:hypothetical protein
MRCNAFAFHPKQSNSCALARLRDVFYFRGNREACSEFRNSASWLPAPTSATATEASTTKAAKTSATAIT